MDHSMLSDPFGDSWWPFIIAFLVGLITCVKSYTSGCECPSKQRIDGKIVIVTGASSGIGYETALELARRGGTIILACRDTEVGNKAVAQIKEEVKDATIHLKHLDLSSLKSVCNFVEDLDFHNIDILINNAGLAFHPFEKTVEGFEMHFVSNYLGHFLLTHLLLPKLKASADARIINVSAQAHHASDMKLDDLNYEDNYTAREAFAQSKLALILMTHHMAKLLKGTNVTINALHPGLVRGTQHMRRSVFSNTFMVQVAMLPWVWLFMKNPKQGAQTSLYVAVAPEVAIYSGKYFGDCEIKQPAKKATDDVLAKALYEKSCALVGIQASPF